MKHTDNVSLIFVPLDMQTERLFVISDASFANARGGNRQLGWLSRNDRRLK